jgi:hypothetical protein
VSECKVYSPSPACAGLTKNLFKIFCLGFVGANVKHHPGPFGGTPPKEGNTPRKASRKKQNREKKMKKILLIMAMVPGAAGAVKMCARNISYTGKYSYNSSLKIWAVGPNCKQGHFNDGNDPEDSATTGAALCGGGNIAYGIAKDVASYSAVIHGATIESLPEFTPDMSGWNSRKCFCKIQYPFESKWIPALYPVGLSCVVECAITVGARGQHSSQKLLNFGGLD